MCFNLGCENIEYDFIIFGFICLEYARDFILNHTKAGNGDKSFRINIWIVTIVTKFFTCEKHDLYNISSDRMNLHYKQLV